MNLIEVMFYYRDVVRADGREAGDKWLRSLGMEEDLFRAVSESVDELGDFVTADGRLFKLRD